MSLHNLTITLAKFTLYLYAFIGLYQTFLFYLQ